MESTASVSAGVTDDRWWRDFDAVVDAMLDPGARVLDVGCGDGGLVERLAARGLDAVGVDPRAPAAPRLIRGRVEDATRLGQFDAVTAVMALHHTDLHAVVHALDRLTRAHGRLFVCEFAWDAYDRRAADWLGLHDASDTDHSVLAWHREHLELHTTVTIKQALSSRFEPVLEVRRPYLARMLGQHDLEANEQALIDAQLLPALGLWYIAQRAG
jgi:SAM-dependent methyltransferase